jgi:hypothetical protein
MSDPREPSDREGAPRGGEPLEEATKAEVGTPAPENGGREPLYVVPLRGEAVSVPTEAPAVGDIRFNYGVQLSKYIILLIGLSIAALVIYLSVLDIKNTNNVDDLMTKIVSAESSHGMSPSPKQVDSIIGIITSLQKAGEPLPASTIVEQAKNTIGELQRSSLVTIEQAKRLGSCVDTSIQHVSYYTELEDCLVILNTIKEIATLRDIDLERLRLLREIAKDIRDYHQAFRSFWLQAGQLILLNLLLPILTALLGYIFGSAQSGRTSQ